MSALNRPDNRIDQLSPDDKQLIAGLLGIHDGERFADMALRTAQRAGHLIAPLKAAAERKLIGSQRLAFIAKLDRLAPVQLALGGPLADIVVSFTGQLTGLVVAHSERQVMIDPGLNRLSIARREMPEVRLWNYGHRAGDGSGKISKPDLFAYVERLGIITSKRTFDSILADGAGLYWKIRAGVDSSGAPVLYVYLTGWRKLAERLVKLCLKHTPDLLDSVLPGMPRVWLDLSGSLQEAAARCYGAWMAMRAGYKEYLDISRAALQKLWNRGRKALLEWEAIIEAEKQSRYAEHNELTSPLIPAHADLCLEVNGQEFASWQITNRYLPKPVKVHQPKGQRRKVRTAINAMVHPSEPADRRGGGRRRVKCQDRIYFADQQRVRRTGMPDEKGRRKAALEWERAAKLLNRHLGKHGDVLEKRHYIETGTRHGVLIVEYSTGQNFRSLHARRDDLAESFPAFAERAAQFRAGWAVQ